MPESELKNINSTFTLNKNASKHSSSDIKITSTLSNKVKAKFDSKEITGQENLTKFDKNTNAFWIDAREAKSFQEENNRYELKLKLEYTRDLKKMPITEAELRNLSANDRLDLTCGNKSVLTESDYNKAKSNLTSYNNYIADKESYDNKKKKITKANYSEYSTYAEYLSGKNGINATEFERISSAGRGEEKEKIKNSESIPYADYTAYLLGKNLINKTEFDTIKALSKPTEVTKTSSEDIANLGENYNAYKSNIFF